MSQVVWYLLWSICCQESWSPKWDANCLQYTHRKRVPVIFRGF